MIRPLSTSEILRCRDEFVQGGVFTIPHFLSEKGLVYAEQALQSAEWEAYVHPRDPSSSNEDAWRAVEPLIMQPPLSYRFHRTFDHEEAIPMRCSCNVCFFRDMLNGDSPFLDRAGIISDRALTSTYGFFSRYSAGSYLAPHNDKDNGELAFVLNLTRDWNPMWGGCLHLLEKDWARIKRTIPPVHNEMVVFEVKEARHPHFVSHVAPGVTRDRYAFSGWLR
jgi:hypothetical protein